MATKNKGGYCTHCQQQRMGSKQVLGDGVGCIITILTGGLFLLFWLPYRWIFEAAKPYMCNVCGHKL